MAKRKKKSSGGAFGGKAKSKPANPFGYGELEDSLSDHERGMKAIQRAIISKSLRTPEELEEFLMEKAADKPLDELMETFAEEGLRTELEEAEDLMDTLDEDASPYDVVRTAEEALEISPECLEAWLALGVHEMDPGKALEFIDKGIAYGRLRFESLISCVEEDLGLWGWIEARDFLRLLEQRAILLLELDQAEEAIMVYQEIIALNPKDNQGVRAGLLRLLLVFHRLEDANALLDRFKNDIMPDIAFGSAFVSIVEAMDKTGYELPEAEAPGGGDSLTTLMNSLGPEFDAAKKKLKKAAEINPFIPLYIDHPQVMGVEVPDMFRIGGPFEAIIYAQKWAPLWYIPGLPILMLTAFASTDVLRPAKKNRGIARELAEVMDTLDRLDDEPWWDLLELQE